jgi:hypothetical protein
MRAGRDTDHVGAQVARGLCGQDNRGATQTCSEPLIRDENRPLVAGCNTRGLASRTCREDFCLAHDPRGSKRLLGRCIGSVHPPGKFPGEGDKASGQERLSVHKDSLGQRSGRGQYQVIEVVADLSGVESRVSTQSRRVSMLTGLLRRWHAPSWRARIPCCWSPKLVIRMTGKLG